MGGLFPALVYLYFFVKYSVKKEEISIKVMEFPVLAAEHLMTDSRVLNKSLSWHQNSGLYGR